MVDSDEASDSPDDSDEIAVRPNPLRDYVKAKGPDVRAGNDGVHLLRDILDSLALNIWNQAAKHAKNDGRETVKERDIRKAYQEVFEPHNLLFQATADLEKLKSQFEDLIDESALSSREDAK